MADPNDGSIVIDCELDTDGLAAGSKELLNAIKSLSNQVKTLGDTIKSTFSSSGQVAQSASTDMQQYQQTVTDLENKVKELQKTVAELQGSGGSGEILNFGKTSAKASGLEKEVLAVAKSAEKLGPTFEKAMSGDEKAISRLAAKLGPLQSRVDSLKQKLAQNANTKVPTEEYARLTNEVAKTESTLKRLYDKQAKLKATGVKENSRTWRSLQYDIDAAHQALNRYSARMGVLETSGGSHVAASQTASYRSMSSVLSAVTGQLGNMSAGLSQVQASETATVSYTQILATALRKVGNTALSAVGKVAKTAFKGLLGSIKLVSKGLWGLISKFKKTGTAAKGLGKSFQSFFRMLKQMITFRVIFAIFNGITQGIQNMAKASTEVNRDMSALKTSLTQLKNSLGAAFAPILNVVTPILVGFMNTLVRVIDTIGMFVAALTGAKTYKKAVKVQEDYAASLDGTGKSAEEAKNQLAGFDDLNILSDNSSKDGGGGGATPDPSTMFEDVAIESPLLDFANSLKESFKKGDFEGVGQILGEKLNGVITRAGELISWDSVGESIKGKVTAFATIVNSLFEAIDWTNLGHTVSEGINTGINTGLVISDSFDWSLMTKSFAEGLNGAVEGINWGNIGLLLSKGIRNALNAIGTGISTFNWAGLGSGLAAAINQIDWVGSFKSAASGLSSAVTGLLDLCIGFVQKLDWGKLGTDLWDSLIGIVANVDWNGLVSKAFELLGSAIGGAGALIVSLCTSIFESLEEGWNSTKSYFETFIDEAGGNIIQGLWDGIVNALASVGTWIKENIFDPFIKGFKEAFGIHSPSTVMEEQGGFIIEGLLQGITSAWKSITTFFSESLSSLKETLSEAWDNIKEKASTAWSKISETVGDAWDKAKSWTGDAVKNVKEKCSEGWDKVKSGASTAWSKVTDTVSDAWSDIKSYVSKKGTETEKSASSTWSNVKKDTTKTNSDISSDVSKTWATVKSGISKQIDNAKKAVSDGWKALTSDTTKTNSGISTDVSKTWAAVKSDISKQIDNAKTAVSNGWKALTSNTSKTNSGISSDVSKTWSDVKSNISKQIDNAKTAAANAWKSMQSTTSTQNNSIKTTAANAWSAIKSSISDQVGKAKDAASTAWKNMSSTASTQHNGIKSSLSTIWGNIRTALSRKLSDISDDMYDSFSDLKSDASTWGRHICENLASGLKNALWKVKNAACDVAEAIWDYLHFTEPDKGPLSDFHTYMPDMIDLMVEGMEGNKKRAATAAAGIAQAISNEVQSDYSTGNIIPTGQIDSALNNFSDKISDSFTGLMDKLQAIANGVTFASPVVASRAVPYSVSAKASGSDTQLSSTIEAGNDRMEALVSRVVTQATASIVAAIRSSGGGNGTGMDIATVTTAVINDINRRTMMNNKSPLLG